MPFGKPGYIMRLFFGLCLLCAVALWELIPTRLDAQGDGDDTNPTQIFLPFIRSDSPDDQVDQRPTDNGSTDSAPTGQDGHTHTHAVPYRESWPPQPVGIENIRWLESTASSGIVAAQQLTDQAEAIASASPVVQAQLGERYVHTSTMYNHAKRGATAAGKAQDVIRVAYFSYTNNSTIEVAVVDGRVTNVQALAASTYQPEPTRSERIDAITLARDYFLRQGETRINELHGFVIMAYQNQGATGFYETRVLYVTFHESLEERPEYLAWVDLSRETVFKAIVDTYQENVENESASSVPAQEAGE